MVTLVALSKRICKDGNTTEIALEELCNCAMVYIYLLQEYKPERFLPDNINRMSSYAFIPFSAGPRLVALLEE